jgi:hypothetical protein
LLAVAVVFLTAAVAISFGPMLVSARAPDTTPLWVIGGLALLGALLIDTHWVRKWMNRVPMLRSAASDFSRVLRDGDHLRMSMETRGTNTDPGQIEEWRRQTREWGEDARRAVARQIPDREHWFVRGLPEVGASSPDDWYTDIRQYLDPRIGRLEELLKEQR